VGAGFEDGKDLHLAAWGTSSSFYFIFLSLGPRICSYSIIHLLRLLPVRLGGSTRFYVIIHERFFVLFKLMNRRIMNQVNHLEKEKRNRLTGDGKDIQVTDTLKGKREMSKMELQGAI
jgi:hypothetical protein